MADDTIRVLIDSFGRLRALGDELAARVLDADARLPAWIPGESPELDFLNEAAREIAARHYGALWYWSDIPERSGGLVAAAPATAAVLARLNAAKEEFKAAVLALRAHASGQRLETLIRNSAAPAGRDEQVAKALEAAGMARVNLRYCYRIFQHLPAGTHTVSWVWIYRTSAIRQITAAEAADLVARKLPPGDLQEFALRTLADLPPERQLAVKRPVAKNLRANIWVGEARPRPIVAHSPLFYSGAEPMPRRRWDYDPRPRPRLERSDRRIRPEPLIAALNLYEYL